MSDVARVGDLELDQDMRYQRRWWRVQTASGWFMGVVIVAALLGAFGSGPLSDVSAGGAASPLGVEYDRFPRLHAPTELEIEIRGGEGATDVAISREYLAASRIEAIEPEPDSTTVLPDRLVHTFEQTPPSLVILRVEPQRFGRLTGTVWGPDGARVEISQFVYP